MLVKSKEEIGKKDCAETFCPFLIKVSKKLYSVTYIYIWILAVPTKVSELEKTNLNINNHVDAPIEEFKS